MGLLLHEQENMGGIPLYRVGVHAMHRDIGRPYPLYRTARYVRIHLDSPESHEEHGDSLARTLFDDHGHVRFAVHSRTNLTEGCGSKR